MHRSDFLFAELSVFYNSALESRVDIPEMLPKPLNASNGEFSIGQVYTRGGGAGDVIADAFALWDHALSVSDIAALVTQY